MDTGAIMMVLGQQEAEELGVWMEELIPTSISIQVANDITEPALRMILVLVSCKNKAGILRTPRQQAYMMEGAVQLFLNHKALEELGCIKKDVFPRPMTEDISQVQQLGAEENKVCRCPTRSLPPPPPAKISIELT